ncbi:MAG TPA: SGNH/GDSL hydrolase family protein, partial [Verrucomicrobiae bacterium]|nr:SGNH/GDSL hydrolase family protein [Verrucomicrobiae bacterium]
YGTSILQGCSASRPGMAHSAILGRRFNWPIINLGFSGNGKMEPELASLLSELDPSVYVLDCVPNMTSQQVAERVEPFVHKLRETHPATPIVLIEDRTYGYAFFFPEIQARQSANRAALKQAYKNLKKSGIKDLYYIPGESLLGDDGDATVDGSHPTDLGMTRQAKVVAKVLAPLLKKQLR